ncbi:hypothetical protein KLP40_05370 [Hymenobacter sp. NST-14]|uniref:fibronectin type III domain-containing protein n=1 Tax=Hymenobacter piscis TaxID=2839984 RepID=UPI001C01A11A|nr:fibronectin type III domain-containing protein [Hymenobacter piscis]MBT9392588.1 hypothetical protein [Hymenobacter piscis]
MKHVLLPVLLLSSAGLALAQKPASRPKSATRPTPAAPAAPAPAPGTTITAARLAGPGMSVTVRGVVTNGPELGQLRFVQDQQAGLAVFSTTNADLHALVPGDSVLLTGTLKDYKGLLEMDPVASVVKLGAGRRVVPLEVAAADLSSAFVEANEGRLLRIKGLSRLTTTGGGAVEKLAGNANYLLDGQPATPIRINVASTGERGIVDKTAPAGSFDLVGSLSQFTQSGTGGYQLLPRTFADFVVAGGLPVVKGEPIPTNIYRNGFTVMFQTVNPGTAKVEYGLTSELGQVVSLPEMATSHRVELENLEPNTTYYVRVSATNAAGTSSSAAVPILTDNKKRPNR